MTQIRFATVGAAEGWAEVVMAASPSLVSSEARVLHEMEHVAGVLARYVAVEDRQVVGIARLRDEQETALRVMVQVHPAHRGRGVGRQLLERLLAVAGGAPLRGIVNGDTHSMAVARHWGFELHREHSISSVDPRQVGPPAPAPAGLHVVPLATAGADEVWACDHAVSGDDPSGLSRPVPFAEYLHTEWDTPLHRVDLGRAVLDRRTVVSFASVRVSGDRAWHSMTGTRPEHRGRGLATLAKQHTLNALAAAGVTAAWTGNDAANAPMLTINDRLGYRRSATTWDAVRKP